MSFTFTNDPASSNRDAIRILLNDTAGPEGSEALSDETIAWLLTENSSVYYAAAAGADAIASQFTSSVSEKQVGDLRTKKGGGDPAAQYVKLAASLRSQAAIKGFKAYSGGISISDKTSQLDDTDRLPDDAAIGMHDNEDGTLAGSTSGRWNF